MDFFDRQAQAQRKTKLLVFYFAMAILTIILVLQIVISELNDRSFFDPQFLPYVAGGVVLVVTLGSVIKIIELAQGGRVVAAMLGGEPLSAHTVNPAEQRLINVVEEMSIASGVPMPEIYVLPDETINAFAAGHGPGDAVIGVTRGCIEQLSRDELQGVIAHEFSHLLHGDMKLNLQLIGLLNGILFLAIIGGIVMRMTAYSRSGGSRDRGNGVAAILLLGLALYLLGWIGVFFGNLIKAAVSRQREFLADASAVQFTRNPGGIAGALWKIGKADSRLASPRASEASHLFFGNGLGDPWLSLFATHPPLEERIKAIDANFQPSTGPATPPPLAESQPATPAGAIPVYDKLSGLLMATVMPFANDAVRDLHDACAFIYALLLDEQEGPRAAQLQGLEVDDSIRQAMMGFFNRRAEIPAAQRLPLVDLAIPTLRNLSTEQYAVFRKNVRHLVESDQAIQLFEFALQKTLIRHLDLFFTRSTGAKVKYLALAPVLPDIAALLSGLAFVGQADEAARDAAFAVGVKALGEQPPLTREKNCDLNRIDTALDRVALVAPVLKRTILEACRETVSHDGKVESQEYELLRAIADTMDCPMPPLAVVS